MVTNLLGLKEPGYKREDFALVGGINYLPNVLIVNTASSKAKTLQELVEFGKANPGVLTFGTNGPQSSPNLMSRRFDALSKIGWREVPYKGAAQVMQDMLGGRIDAFFGLPSTGMGVLGNPNMAIFAITDSKRLASLPSVPTFTELGYRDLDDIQIGGIWVPAATPKPVMQKLRAALAEILKSAEFAAQLEKIGALVYSGTPEEFERVVQNIEEKYRADFKAFDIAPE
jgi:tripartite-type tricarboxylate transporter receptor subunit TctC